MFSLKEKILHTGKKAKLGEVSFLETSLKDKHIKDLIQALSEFTNKSVQELETEAEEKYNQYKSKMTHEVLHGTSSKNIAEQVLFGMMEDYKFQTETAPKFNAMIFKKLSMMIEAENPGMFPLQSIISKKSFEPKYIFVPSETNKEFNSVKTAAATNDGRFIYNIPFMQQLINFAFIKDVKPKGKKYQANGGEIPNYYAPIEFLILHEILHLVQADNYYQKKYKANHKIINYVGDFRSNYELVKTLGTEHQLPIGLYSDMVNYDRQSSYKEMYELVKKSLEEHKEDQKDDDQQGEGGDSDESDDGLDSHDDHTTEHDNEEVDKEHEENQKGKGSSKGKGKPSDGDSEEKGEGSADGDGEPTDEELEAMDKKHKEISDALKERKEVATAEEAKKQKGQRGAEGKQNTSTTDVKLDVPVGVNWKVLLDKLIKKVIKSEMTTSYTKMNKRSITSASLAVSSGASAVKPGEVIASEEKNKLIFVIDSSGSMQSAIPKIHSQILHTLEKYNKTLDDEFYVVKFSDTHEVYRCSFKKSAFEKVHLEEISNNKTTQLKVSNKNLLELFRHSIGGATTFESVLVHHLSKATKNGSSVIIFTDSDVLYGENEKLLKLLFADSLKTSIGMVFSEFSAYTGFIKAFGSVYTKFVTVLE